MQRSTKQFIAPISVMGIGLGVFACLQPSSAAPDVIDLSTTYGVKINGADVNDLSGFSIAGAGDVNKDGIGDLIIGAPIRDLPQGRWFSGSAYLLYGSPALTNVDLAALTPAQGFQIEGAAINNWTGRSVSTAGDVNGDGFSDVIIAAPYASPPGRIMAGISTVIFGGATGATVDLRNLDPAQGFQILGTSNPQTQVISVSGAGDFNGDGFDDVAIGTPNQYGNGHPNAGSTYVIFGKGKPGTVDLGALAQADGIRIEGADLGDRSGRAVAGAGDLNGDGKADVLIGAPGADPSGRADAGRVYAVFGGASPGNLNLAQLKASEGLMIDGAMAGDEAGKSVAAALDVNDDGHRDILLGAPSADPAGRTDAGASYVVLGNASPSSVDLATLTPAQGFAISGAAAGDASGASVAGLGDVSGDGYRDVAIGAPNADGLGRQDAGTSYVVLGSASPTAVDLATLPNGLTAIGAAASNESGFAVARAGDINGDGNPDLAIGAPYADGSASSSGVSYVLFGATPPPKPPPTQSPSVTPSVTPSPTTPTPTPTPTPTISRKKLPLRVKAKKGALRYTPSTWTPLVKWSKTNIFGLLKYRVTVRPLGSAASGEVKYATWRTTHKGGVQVRIRGYEDVRVRVWIRAVPKPDASSEWKANSWRATWTLRSR